MNKYAPSQIKWVLISSGRYPGFLIEWIFDWIESSQIKKNWIEFSGKKDNWKIFWIEYFWKNYIE